MTDKYPQINESFHRFWPSSIFWPQWNWSPNVLFYGRFSLHSSFTLFKYVGFYYKFHQFCPQSKDNRIHLYEHIDQKTFNGPIRLNKQVHAPKCALYFFKLRVQSTHILHFRCLSNSYKIYISRSKSLQTEHDGEVILA